MIFEVGKCYEHTTGLKMRMLAEVDTCFYGHCMISEDNYGRITPIGTTEESTVNWTECEDFLPDPEKGETIEDVVMPAEEIDISGMNPDAVATKPDDVVLEEEKEAEESSNASADSNSAEENTEGAAESSTEESSDTNETD